MDAGIAYKLAWIWVLVASLPGCITSIEIIQNNRREPGMDVHVITATGVITLTTKEPKTTISPSPVPLTSTPSPIPPTFTVEPTDPPTLFTGAWRSIDIDGSRQEMYIGSEEEEGTYPISFTDHAANFCDGSTIVGKGAGQIGSDDVMHTELDVRCLGELEKRVDDVDYWLAYNEASDTLTDVWGITWNRIPDNP
jgi:hypothetical protein